MTLAGAAAALVVAVWAATLLMIGLQEAGCRLEGAAGARTVEFRIPGGCYARAADGGWRPLAPGASPPA